MAAAGNETPAKECRKEMYVGYASIPKLPPYTPEAVTSWFAVAETHFEALGCKEDLIKFTSVLQALDETSLMFAR